MFLESLLTRRHKKKKQGYIVNGTYKVPISPKASNGDWKDTQSNEEVSNFGSSPHWYMSWMLKR